ncbi:Mur ligase family protein, partial [Enterococcus pallens]
APDCIVALFEVYGGEKGLLRRVHEYWNVSDYSRKVSTGRKKLPQRSNLYDYYKIGEYFLALQEETLSLLANKNHIIHGKLHKAQSHFDGKAEVIASIFWGTDQSDCLVFYKKEDQLTCSLVINGKNLMHTSELAMNPSTDFVEPEIRLKDTHTFKECLETNFKGYFLNEKIAENIIVDHTVCDQSSVVREKWENVAYIAFSAESFRAMIPKSKRDFHGNELISKYKIEENISVIITDKPIPQLRDKIPQFIVPNSFTFAYEYACYQIENYDGKFCAITGSAGKSSTRLMLNHLLSDSGKSFGNFGNANLHYSTFSLTLEVNNQYDHILLEAAVGSMNRWGYGNNAYLWKADVVIVTSFGSAHALSTIEGNLRVKKHLFHGVKENGYVVINKDMEERYLEKFIKKAESLSLNILFSSLTDTKADCYLLEKCVLKEKTKIRVNFRGKELSFCLTTDSDGQIQNAMSSLLAIDVMGYQIEEHLHLLESYQSFERILRPLQLTLNANQVTVVDDTHNSSVESMINGIEYFSEKKKFYQGKRVLVLGEIADLGKDTIMHHKRLIPHINEAKPDHIIMYGKPFKELVLDVKNVTLCDTKEEAAQKVIEESTEDSFIYVKGSHGIGFHEVIDFLKKQAESNQEAKNDKQG